MSHPMTEFDDPNLQAAVHRAARGTGADADLRARMTALVARETSDETAVDRQPLRLAPRRSPARWIAAAAVLLLASALGGFAWHRHHLAEEAEEYLAANLPL